MAIYCMQCGKELPDDASFCLKCGMPVGGAANSTPLSEPKWEYCEIGYIHKPDIIKNNNRGLGERMLGGRYYNIVFFAEGIGPQGTFDVTKGNEFKGRIIYSTDRNFLDYPIDLADFSGRAYPLSDNSEDSAAVKNLVGYLTQQGWEPLPSRGEYWFSYKVRRRIS